MKRFGIFWAGLRASVSSIHLVNRCLILYTAVLLAQSVYSLFAPEQTLLAGEIDTMVRTSLAAVFGYFLSGSFNAGSSGKEAQEELAVPKEDSQPKEASVKPSFAAVPPLQGAPQQVAAQQAAAPQEAAQQGAAWQAEAPQTAETLDAAEPTVSKETKTSPTVSRLQILLAAGMGLVCLVALLVLRCFPGLAEQAVSGSPAATVAQFRDLVSGCIGFLIGCPVHGSSKES